MGSNSQVFILLNLKGIIMTENIKWTFMVDYLTNGGNITVSNTFAHWLTDKVGKVSEARKYKLLVKPITE